MARVRRLPAVKGFSFPSPCLYLSAKSWSRHDQENWCGVARVQVVMTEPVMLCWEPDGQSYERRYLESHLARNR